MKRSTTFATLVVVALLVVVAVGATQADFSPPGEDLDESEVEAQFVTLLNEERESRGLDTVEQRDVLTEMGESHAENMAENETMAHQLPNGTTPAERFRDSGLLPGCRIKYAVVGGYYQGAENVYMTANYESIRVAGDDTIEEALAKSMFTGWMNSKGHRIPMTLGDTDSVGLGMETNGRDIYAALEMCGSPLQ